MPPGRELRRCRACGAGQTPSQVVIADDAAQRLRQCGDIAGGDEQTGVRRHRVRYRARNGANDGVDGWAAVDYGLAYANPMTAIPYWIKAGEGPGTNMDSRAGLRSYMDVKANATDATSNQATSATSGDNYHNDKAPAFMIELQRSSSSVATSDSPSFHIGGGSGGQLYLEDKSAAKNIRAISKAQAYFSRPSDLFGRADGKQEYGSLYSPYWQVRLLPSSVPEQLIGVGAQMLGL